MDKRPPRERSDSTEANAARSLSRADAVEAMDRFKNLTRKLLSVPREKIQIEQQRHDAEQAALRQKRKIRKPGTHKRRTVL
jgi:hypothetical protein